MPCPLPRYPRLPHRPESLRKGVIPFRAFFKNMAQLYPLL